MKMLWSLLVVVACIVASAENGFAARVNKDVWASKVFVQSVSLGTGSHTFVTYGSTGVDTVLHLYSNAASSEVAMNDDCRTGQAPGNPLNSCITYTVTTAGTYTVIVHSYTQASRGIGDVYKDGVVWYQGTSFGGARIPDLPGGTTESDYYETALKPSSGAGNGCTDTVLFALDPSMHLVGGSRPAPDPDGTAYFDDDAGVGYSSRIIGTAGSTNISQIVVGSYTSASEGLTDLYVNDYLNDTNGNGLGQQLEGELETILTSSLPTSTVTPACL